MKTPVKQKRKFGDMAKAKIAAKKAPKPAPAKPAPAPATVSPTMQKYGKANCKSAIKMKKC